MASTHCGNGSSPDSTTTTNDPSNTNQVDTSQISPTARSSYTLFDHVQGQSYPAVLSAREELNEEIANEEHNIEVYAGDDPHKPTADKVPAIPEEDKDANVVTWDGPADPANPKNWTSAYRWFLTCLCCITTFNVTFASAAPTSALTYMANDLNISKEVSDLVTSLFLVGYIAGPIIWGPGSELLGRQPVFRISMICSTLFILGQSLAPNIQTLLITRFLAGVFASAPLTNCSGVMADMWDPARRGVAMSLFVACVFVGPVCGPVVGSFVTTSYLGWRWVFWIMMIFSALCTILVGFFMPETFTPVLLQKKAQRLRKSEPEKNAALYAEHEKHDWSPRGVLHRTLYRPFYMLYKEPILVLATIYISFNYGLLYALFEAVPIIFVETRHFSINADGLMFLGVGIGTCLGALLNLLFSRRYAALTKRWRGFPPPEERLYGAMIAGPALVAGALWLGWAGQYAGVHWVVPALGLILIGLAICLIFSSLLAYLVDTYLTYSASAFAANVMCRSVIAAAFPLFTVQMYERLGVNWASTLIACIGLLLTPGPFLFYKYGPRIRAGSTFAPCIDLKIAKELAAEEREKSGSEKV
ncbi:MFS polyamine transporter [Athelia psychrophila]|uniref:MFS polyamine transporter n=1 Tax=Athelia psychrophila TaxID=1759441 RepID=A0A166CTP5_9AGAM|nr:MFS polyamine transporter [Fibularhizoctonia sp. CBS 109695]KZP13996.1 MFS polyamine transporter [Fibularhizoctonia sp. CBS 109695]